MKNTDDKKKERLKKSSLTADVPSYRYYGVKRKDHPLLNKIAFYFTHGMAYYVLAILLFAVGIVMFNLYRYLGVFIPTVITLIIVFLLVRTFYFKKLGKRVKFERKLKRLCGKNGFVIERNTGFWKSMRFISEGYHFVVKTNEKNYYVRYITNFNYNTEVILCSKTEIQIRKNINAHKNRFKVLMGIEESYDPKEFRHDEAYGTAGEKYENIVLFNPVPRGICYIDRDGTMTPTGSGEKLFGYTIYNGTDFLSLLQKNI